MNWNKDLNAILHAYHSRRSSTDVLPLDHSVPMESIAMMTFRHAAKMHATFWMDRSLLQHSWLRGQSWLIGKDEQSWVDAQATVQAAWQKLSIALHSGATTVAWDPRLLRCIKASMDKISWSDYLVTVSSPEYRWTLVHGKGFVGNAHIG